MTIIDYKVMDMPTHLSRTALKQDPTDSGKWVRDESWYDQTRAINDSLYKFFISADLISRNRHFNSIEDVVIMLSDLNELGKRFVLSGAVDRWLGSFDRPGSKKALSDVRYLEKALRDMVGASH